MSDYKAQPTLPSEFAALASKVATLERVITSPVRVFPVAIAASAAANNTLFRDAADDKLKFKDDSGTVNALY